MVRNEFDIIELFVKHLVREVDEIHIIDHLSDDGTFEFLTDCHVSGLVHLYRYESPSYDQSELMTHMAQRLMQSEDIDWIILLDGDEFIPDSSHQDNESVAAILERHHEEPAVSFKWVNLIPEEMNDKPIESSTRFDISKVVSRYNTVALNTAILRGSDFIVEQGNHSVLEHPYAIRRTLPVAGHVFHVPIRSLSQLLVKLGTGLRSYEARNIPNNDGKHWKELDRYRRDGELSEDVLKKVILYYGELDKALEVKKSYKELSGDFVLGATPFVNCEASLSDLVTVMRSSEVGELEVLTRYDLVSDKSRGVGTAPFPELKPYAPGKCLSATPTECMHLAMEVATWPIRDLMPTAWAGHIPFMFTLFSLARPQRYVELGTHHGASFLAACQVADRLNLATQLVAVDTWEGDEQAGFYGEEVYNQLVDIVRRRDYTDSAYLVRERFESAANLFESASIDLLHIDGLHTYEAVAQDYATWKPKLATGGTIIFHDTNVHERDFGVWKLWSDVRSEGISFEFKHGHGLGVLHFPGEEDSDLTRVLKHLNDSPSDARFVQSYFETIAPRLELEARIRYLELRTAGNLNKFVDRALSREKEYLSQSAEVSEAKSKLALLNKRLVILNKRLDRSNKRLARSNKRLAQRNEIIRNRDEALKENYVMIRRLRKRNAKLVEALIDAQPDAAPTPGGDAQVELEQPVSPEVADKRLKAKLRNTTLGEAVHPYYRRLFAK